MSSVIETLERAQLRRVPNFSPGDRVKVHFQVIEGTRRRIQVFEGVVIKRQGHGARETFTVRKQSFGIGVERMFPVHSPKIERIELAARGDVRRAKLYYLRDRIGKRARVRERRYVGPEETVQPGLMHEPPQASDGMGTQEEAVGSAQQLEADGVTPQATPGEQSPQEQQSDSEDSQTPAASESEEPAGALTSTPDEVDASSSDAGDAQGGEAAGDAPA